MIKCDNLYWVDGLKYNLLSVEQLISTSQQVDFHNKKENIYDATEKLVGSSEKKRGTCLFAQHEDV